MASFDLFLRLAGASYEALIVLILTAITCGLIGAFLVLRKLSMIADAISHTVLLGIVFGYFIAGDLQSPLLIIGAGIFGLITVFATESLSASNLVKNDDAIGIVYPLFFAIAVILISVFARNVHLDMDMVLMGEVILAPINRMTLFGISLPKALVQNLVLLLLNGCFILVFFKELKLSTFDPAYSRLSGFSTTLIFYLLMTLTSFTTVVAFDSVGAILVISFMIAPGASAYLISKDLKKMLGLTCGIAILNSVLGFTFSLLFNVSMSGATASVAGVVFMVIFLVNPSGIVTQIIRRHQKRQHLRMDVLLLHIENHSNQEDVEQELGVQSIGYHLNWPKAELARGVNRLQKQRYIYIEAKTQSYQLTQRGRERLAQRHLEQMI